MPAPTPSTYEHTEKDFPLNTYNNILGFAVGIGLTVGFIIDPGVDDGFGEGTIVPLGEGVMVGLIVGPTVGDGFIVS